MVDLGFLLITFFMMTTTMSKPKAMDIQMPSKQPTQKPTVWYESSAITLLPAGNHRFFYYEGIFSPDKPLKMAASITGLRKVLQHKQNSIRNRSNLKERDLQVLIKPDADASFSDIVALFDEMHILAINSYAMVDISQEETAMIQQYPNPTAHGSVQK
jgi:biopolymer transport protein ExbD